MPLSIETSSSSSLAALSAQNSLKRTRILYDVNPQAAFLPGVDPTILQASINRRKRRVQPQHQQTQQQQTRTAVSLVSEGIKPLPSSSNATNKNKPSTALILAGDANQNANNKASGILVVRLCKQNGMLRNINGLSLPDFFCC